MAFSIASGQTRQEISFDNVLNTDYADRDAVEGGGDNTNINQTQSELGTPSVGNDFTMINGINIANEEKLGIAHNVVAVVLGAGTAPGRTEMVFKMDTTTLSGQYTRVDIDNTGTGDFDIDSNLSALGTD